MRIDKYLFEKGLAKSRSYAAVMISQGLVFCNTNLVTKASYDVSETDTVEIVGEVLRYVSRGGLKLEGALKHFSLSVNGLVAVDIGASTGGFTDCLLQNGALRVYAIDSGSAQLHKSLLEDSRVISMENTNVRYLTKESIPELCDLAVCDVSFISQTLLHANIAAFLKDGAQFITLIKPQFECGRTALNKKGIVTDQNQRKRACEQVIASAESVGFHLKSLIDSDITGGDGNHEFLALFCYQNESILKQ